MTIRVYLLRATCTGQNRVGTDLWLLSHIGFIVLPHWGTCPVTTNVYQNWPNQSHIHRSDQGGSCSHSCDYSHSGFIVLCRWEKRITASVCQSSPNWSDRHASRCYGNAHLRECWSRCLSGVCLTKYSLTSSPIILVIIIIIFIISIIVIISLLL